MFAHNRLKRTFSPNIEQLEDRCLMSTVPFDTTFGNGGKQTTLFDLGAGNKDQGAQVAVQADGKIVVVGSAQRSTPGDFDFAVVRYNVDGSLDTSFNSTGKRTIAFDLGGNNEDRATGVTIQADGKIVISGYAQRNNSGDYDFAVARLNANGQLDTSFNSTGKRTIAFDLGGNNDDRASDVAIQADGKIVLGGYAQRNGSGDYDFAVARLNAGGSLDTSFNSTGKRTVAFDNGGGKDDRATSVAIQSDGKIVLAGYSQFSSLGDYDFAVARLTTGGALDTSFSSDGKTTVAFDGGGVNDDRANDVAIQADGKIVVVGYSQFDLFFNKADCAIVRLTTGGNIDSSFSGGGKTTFWFDPDGSNDSRATGVVIQADGKIVVSAFAQRSGDNYDFAFQRLNADGASDFSIGNGGAVIVSFDKGGNKDDRAVGIALTPDGKIVLAGSAHFSGSDDYDFAVARLNPTRGTAAWTFFVYMTVSTLGLGAATNLNQMEAAAAQLPGNVNIVVFLDQSSGLIPFVDAPFLTGNGNVAWSGAGRGVINGDTDMGRVTTTFTSTFAEANSGDPQTLEDFLRWGASVAPAQHYGLALWGHGGGLVGSNQDDEGRADGSGDLMTIPDVVQALTDVAPPLRLALQPLTPVLSGTLLTTLTTPTVKIDVLSYDACLMGMAEVGYELRNVTSVFVASEEEEPTWGQDYLNMFMRLMTPSATATATQLGSDFVNAYEALYPNGDPTVAHPTLSATSTSGYTELVRRLKVFSDTAVASATTSSEWHALADTIDSTITYNFRGYGSSDNFDYRDLRDYMKRVANGTIFHQALRDAAVSVRDFLNEGGSLVINRSADGRGSAGVAIYLPNRVSDGYINAVKNFADASGWGTFLKGLNDKGYQRIVQATSVPSGGRSITTARSLVVGAQDAAPADLLTALPPVHGETPVVPAGPSVDHFVTVPSALVAKVFGTPTDRAGIDAFFAASKHAGAAFGEPIDVLTIAV